MDSCSPTHQISWNQLTWQSWLLDMPSIPSNSLESEQPPFELESLWYCSGLPVVNLGGILAAIGKMVFSWSCTKGDRWKISSNCFLQEEMGWTLHSESLALSVFTLVVMVHQGNLAERIIHYNLHGGVDNGISGIIIPCQPPCGDYNGLSFPLNFPDGGAEVKNSALKPT